MRARANSGRFRARTSAASAVKKTLQGARRDVPYVMGQVGHADSATTLEVYSQVLERRERRTVGQAFDRLMRDAIPSEPERPSGPPTTRSGGAETAKVESDHSIFGPQPGLRGPNSATSAIAAD